MKYQILVRSQYPDVYQNFDPPRSWHRTAGRWIPGARSSVSCKIARKKKKRNWRRFFPGKQRRRRRSISRNGTPKRKSKSIASCWILSSFLFDEIVPRQNLVSPQLLMYQRSSRGWWTCSAFFFLNNFPIRVFFPLGAEHQARNQLGTPGGAKSFLWGAQIFLTMSNSFKLRPTALSRGSEKFCKGGFSPLCPLVTGLLNTPRFCVSEKSGKRRWGLALKLSVCEFSVTTHKAYC